LSALLAAYYTNNIAVSQVVLRAALALVALLFFVLESRHANLVEAVVERVAVVEKRIADARQPTGQASGGWYDGPKVSDACQEGVNRWWPRPGMTLMLNLTFYLIVILIILLATVSLPPKGKAAAASFEPAVRQIFVVTYRRESGSTARFELAPVRAAPV